MSEKIISITEVFNVPLEKHGFSHWYKFDGFKIVTSKHTYIILIDNGQCCCEHWGYFSSEDDFSKFIGKQLASVVLTDTALKQEKVEESGYYDDCGGIQFVDFKMTDGSVLQFAVYNAHYGYYGHSVFIAKDEDILLNNDI